ncbi:hypothetical protein DL93DRAFT_2086567 [Clavulina sp. PMI_390]|nr:hypothetical protein DL93DRAFT_2086567 [Clavulina sp. PMI_390]
MVVARIFWYAYVHEGITSGLRGGKLIFDNDDLHVFEASHSKFRGAGIHGFALTAQPTLDRLSYKFSTAPIRLSTACRQINHALTGPKASLRRDVNGKELREGWEKLTQSWQEFDELREVLMNNDPSVFLQRPDMERFISGWQIFLFECLNVIREVLSQKLNEEPASPPQEAFISELDESGQPPSADARAKNLQNLHDLSESYCRDRFPRVMELVTHQLGSPTFFQWDASLVRDGTFYAGKWAATETNGSLDHVQTCITALRKMKWAFSLSEERIQTIQHAYNRRVYGGVGPSSPLTPFTGHPDSRAEALREQVFAGSHFTSVPSMPSESAGLVGQDPFEASWHAAATQPAYGHHTQGDMHAHSELPMWPQQQQLSQQQAVAVANGIPASKLNRLSPDELEAHGHAPPQQRTGVSPPSATSSQAEFPQQYRSSGYQGAVASEPYHDAHIPRTSYPGQQNQSWEPDNHSSAAGHMPAFVRIDSNAGHSYLPPANDPYQLHRGQQESAYHAGHGHGHQHGLIPHSHPHHGHGDSHSDEGSNDALYMAGNQGMNRTRYPPGFMEGGGYNA